jgi:hypothetical protein
MSFVLRLTILSTQPARLQNGTHSVAPARNREKFTQPKTHHLTLP